jgi:hypothetical protein
VPNEDCDPWEAVKTGAVVYCTKEAAERAGCGVFVAVELVP